MIRASALYIVIVVALVIGVICSALIVTGYFYRLAYQQKFRYDMLNDNLHSGINMMLAGQDSTYGERTLSLFGRDNDSVRVKRIFWGAYDVGIVTAFIQKDSISSVFSIGRQIDTVKRTALYLADFDSPLSVSGAGGVIGNAALPKAGVQVALTESAHDSKQKPVLGKISTSKKELPSLDANITGKLQKLFTPPAGIKSLWQQDTIINSFQKETRAVHLGSTPVNLKNKYLNGNIIIYSDTTVTIDSTTRLNNIMIVARSIIVNNHFRGNCQLFASDSVKVGKNCLFNYPSCIGVLRSKSDPGIEPEIKLGDSTMFYGVIFTLNKLTGLQQPKIVLENRTKIFGDIYSQSEVMTKGNVGITGSVYTLTIAHFSNFRYSRNYLIDARINSNRLSRYYLTSSLLSFQSGQKKILQWLE
ncbi:hypothetical protein [Mucilaginibacter sp. L3T2-6]|uniref:hypothetical protein n=1 Tax=Mucilaginibacter sp. L3T2-6 TaxID=3062491 RepID=UPI002676757B|nr:hypothetical protein [Mucilaginibacter sp. L3T2-6]MDO3645223.1 hypothetical protein [Mucilaginibacter sp. L3T2-6]MDV6217675.1 hypothetical protein [Mucilaginibacter sp. L3T2-6]